MRLRRLHDRFRSLLRSTSLVDARGNPGAPQDPQEPRVTPEHVRWAFRLLLDREFTDPAGVDFWVEANPTPAELRRAILLSEEFQRKNAAFAPRYPRRRIVLGEIESGLRLYVDLADSAIGLGVLDGTYEREEGAWLLEQAAPGDVCIDVGANIGYFTMLLAARVGPSGRVMAYEPHPANVDLIARSLKENGLEAAVTLRPVAVGDAEGQRELTFVPEERATNSGGAYLLAPGGTPPRGHQKIQVPVVALDHEAMPGRVALIKIDVEGAEPLVLKGAQQLLRRDRPRVLAEINPKALRRAGAQPADPVTLMTELGYRAFRLRDGLRPFVPSDAEGGVVSIVFLATP